MVIQDKWRRLIPEQIKNAPDFPGVYEFADILQEKVFIGRAESLAHRIQEIFENRTPEYASVAFFRFHASQDFENEYVQLIEEYKQQYNCLPPINQKKQQE